MSAPIFPDDEIARLRIRLDDLALRQSGEISAMRCAISDLERKISRPETRPVAAVPERRKSVEPDEPQVEPERIPRPKPSVSAAKPAEPVCPPEIPEPAPEVAKPAERGSFELRMGRVWLVRLGIVLLVTGLVLLGNHAYRNWIRELPAFLRLSLLFLGSIGLTAAGWRFTLNEGLRRFGEVVMAGGLAFFYWCAYAAHHVGRLRVVESPVLSFLMLLGAAGLIVGISLRRDSRTTAVMGILLASYSTILQPLGWLSAVSNVLLAAAGVGLMRRPSWSAPGIAAMAGSYGAFLWWQIAGAAGGTADRIGLFYLPATWAVFALPGLASVLEKIGRSLSDRGRAWFAGANNGAFFGLFSLLWMMLGYGSYWLVPACFGALLLALAAAGRRAVGGVHFAQGIALLTLALVIRLDGHQLAFGLAVEGLMLAGAFLRFRRPTELVFSGLVQLGALGVVLNFAETIGWTAAVVALVQGATGLVIRLAHRRLDPGSELAREARPVAALGIVAATVSAIVWCLGLPPHWGLMSALAMGLAVTALVLRFDRSARIPELRLGVAALAVVAASVALTEHSVIASWSWLTCILLSGASAVLWETRAGGSARPAATALAWMHGLFAAGSLMAGTRSLGFEREFELVAMAVLVPGLAAISTRVLSAPRLAASIALLLGFQLVLGFGVGGLGSLWCFIIPASALATFFGAAGGPRRDPLADGVMSIACRITALLGWVLAWRVFLPGHWLEAVGLSGGVLMVLEHRYGRKLPESRLLLLVSGIAVLAGLSAERWVSGGAPELPGGWGVVAGFVIAVVGRSGEDPLRLPVRCATAVLLALWSTRWVVGLSGWPAATVLWTGLGFGFVSVGLLRKVGVWRLAGFALLAAALLKLFAIDVWDFNGFARILAFLALGVALLVLGFFYNRFTDALRRLLEGER